MIGLLIKTRMKTFLNLLKDSRRVRFAAIIIFALLLFGYVIAGFLAKILRMAAANPELGKKVIEKGYRKRGGVINPRGIFIDMFLRVKLRGLLGFFRKRTGVAVLIALQEKGRLFIQSPGSGVFQFQNFPHIRHACPGGYGNLP
jgi:hypothetical protein